MIIASTYGRSTFRIFRQVQTDLNFLVRDIDRQPVSLNGTLVMYINDDYGNTLVTAPLTLVNADRAQYQVSITSNQSASLDTGIYSWCVQYTDTTNVNRLLYTNQDYTVRGVVEVINGILSPTPDPFTITTFTQQTMGLYVTSVLPGSLMANNLTGNHSALASFDPVNGYTGTIYVDAGLDTSIPVVDSDWQQVAQFDFSDNTTSFLMNFYGNFNYIRFRLTSVTGLTQIVYRN